jgi:hypothetical protein
MVLLIPTPAFPVPVLLAQSFFFLGVSKEKEKKGKKELTSRQFYDPDSSQMSDA